jgi:hypothetical protein
MSRALDKVLWLKTLVAIAHSQDITCAYQTTVFVFIAAPAPALTRLI